MSAPPGFRNEGEVRELLADIDADHADHLLRDRRYSVLLVWVPLTSLALAEEEHGGPSQ
jgi:hypothetical protein